MNTRKILPYLTGALCFIVPGLALAQSGPNQGSGSSVMMLFGLYVLAIALALVEICLIPGHGVSGLAAVGVLAYCGYQAFSIYGYGKGALITFVLLALAVVVVYVAVKIMARTEAGKALVLDKDLGEAETSGMKSEYEADLWIGRKLKAITDLRPGGKASYEDQTHEVFSEGEFLHSGDILEVFKVKDGKLFVRKAEGGEEA